MSAQVLGQKDVNAPLADQQVLADGGKDVKSMEYHRKVFQSKIQEPTSQQYVSPSDNIMSPCTAKINALRNKHASKAKPRSLFAQASAKRLRGQGELGTDPVKP
jgi:hypothetical protein